MLIGYILLALGGFLCLLNFYLSALRYPIHVLRGGTRESYRYVSGIPLFASLIVAISLPWGWGIMWWRAVGLILIAIDTGGLHMFIAIMTWQWFRARSRPH
ncbi:MAG: hypothetical protein JXO22_08520 [Phycisphaerae bacterium]|nr:hypothetical protein [Phycisphaerae bacterium]